MATTGPKTTLKTETYGALPLLMLMMMECNSFIYHRQAHDLCPLEAWENRPGTKVEEGEVLGKINKGFQ